MARKRRIGSSDAPDAPYAFARVSTTGVLAEAVMSAAEALRAALAAGITVVLGGEALLLEAEAEPPQALLDALLRRNRCVKLCQQLCPFILRNAVF